MMRTRMKFGRLGLAIAAMAALGAVTGTAQAAVSDSASIDGTYAGTFVCARGEMGMTLAIKSGEESGGTVGLTGVLNFFPTAANPGTPAGAFRVSGSADVSDASAIKIELAPGEWIEKPERWGSAAMTATLTGNTMAGKPVAPGCETLLMRKISE